MKIAIVGAGFVGLTAAYNLTKQGFDVTVFEKENLPGGLAIGFKPACPLRSEASRQGREEKWEWFLENHYHHFFTSDKDIQNLAKEVNTEILFKRPKTKSLIEEKIYPLDSPIDVLLFLKLPFIERIRMGLTLAFLKFNPFWKPMEKISAVVWLKKYMGEKAYTLLWEPLLKAKFGVYKNDVPLSWFWARIKKRSASLGYPVGGFQNLAEKIEKMSTQKGAKFYFKTEVKEIKKAEEKIKIICSDDSNINIKQLSFDKVIVTLPSQLFIKIAKDLPNTYIEKLKKLKMLSALNLVLILSKSFFQDNTYWLNICNGKYPFLSIVEHTNFMDKKYYNNEHIVYIGNYLPYDHPYMKMTADELLKIYDPYLREINPTYHLSLITYHLFSDPFAQPIISTNYSKIIPSFKTPIKNIYLANMQQVYPWDRGVNYAVELGEKIAKLVIKV